MLLKELREAVVEAGQFLYDARYVGFADGNVSARDPETNLVAVKPSGIPWPKIRVEDVAIIDVDGNMVDGKLKPSSETPMHTLFYRNREDVNAVVHSHAPVSTAWSVVGKAIPSFIVNQILTRGEIPIAAYTPPGTEALGQSAYDVMGKEGLACVLQSHGTLAVGGSLHHALHVSFALEDAAKVAMYVKTIGGDPRPMTDQDFKTMMESYAKIRAAAKEKAMLEAEAAPA
jgi:ribulose-5-phosphate 4-epimerase/fuculose-1-phosphate aldolase